ncbi:MAG: hypothetical protein LQ351_004097 [Letrouitia transgressa]|nr:MAG: hypothetical protein LQ351_004097 [Letrouitia transgressa]
MKLQHGYFFGHLLFLNVERSSASAPISECSKLVLSESALTNPKLAEKFRGSQGDSASSAAAITSPPFVLPGGICGEFCGVDGDIQTVIEAPKPPVDNPTRFALQPSEFQPSTYLVFQFYTIRSDYFSEGNCISTDKTGSLTSAFSILRPSDANTKAFQGTAELSFIDFLGFTTCTRKMTPTIETLGADISFVTAPLISTVSRPESSEPQNFQNMIRSSPIDTATTTLASSASDRPRSSLQSSTIEPTGGSAVTTAPNESLSTGPKIGIGIGVPVFAFSLLLLGYLLWQRRRNLKQKLNRQPEELDNDSMYHGVPQEIHAETRRLEVEGDGGIHELVDFERQYKLEPRQPSHAVAENS